MNLQEQLQEQFKNHGVQMDIDNDDVPLSTQIVQQDPETLKTVLQEVSDINNLNLSGDDQVQGLTISFALLNAFENNAESITEEDIEAAQREVAEFLNNDSEDDVNVEVADSDETDDVQEANTEDSESEDTEPRKVHNPALKETVYDLVQNNPDAQKLQVVNWTLEQIPDANEGTISVHYYNARKEFDLQPIGKRGRPANSGKLPQIRQMIQDNPDASRADIIARCVSELGLKESTAANYYAKACK